LASLVLLRRQRQRKPKKKKKKKKKTRSQSNLTANLAMMAVRSPDTIVV